IHESDAARIDAVLERFLGDSGSAAVLLIERSGEPLAMAGAARTLDTVSIAALAAGAFSSTAALARLLGESEFSVLFHEGAKESLHVSTVDAVAILRAIFDGRPPVGMARLCARGGSRGLGATLVGARRRPRHTGALAAPLTPEEARSAIRQRPA